jgi:hypothetical protein
LLADVESPIRRDTVCQIRLSLLIDSIDDHHHLAP